MNTAPQKQQTNWFQQLQEFEAKRPAVRKAGIKALNRLIPVAQRGTGQSAVVGRFLLGLYNGHDYPFVLTSLRGLDTALFEDCLAVLQLDFSPEQEVHTYFPNGDAIWAELIRAWA